MSDISVLMPVIAAIGTLAIVGIAVIVRGMEKRERIKSVNVEKLNEFLEMMRHENVEIRKSLQEVEKKVEEIAKMMKEI
ncbi:MAG: hypothetical protein Q4A78_10220 [Peptostreptococcaceae bacterium]|nr:hypothetical protein [Peptostreptococcaceae bacterium]